MQHNKDSHHVIHERVPWEVRPSGKFIRRIPALVPYILRDDHETIHRNCPPIPVLGYAALQLVANRMQDHRHEIDTFTALDHLKNSFEYAGRHHRAHPIERELAFLAIEAIETQEPYLRDAIL